MLQQQYRTSGVVKRCSSGVPTIASSDENRAGRQTPLRAEGLGTTAFNTAKPPKRVKACPRRCSVRAGAHVHIPPCGGCALESIDCALENTPVVLHSRPSLTHPRKVENNEASCTSKVAVKPQVVRKHVLYCSTYGFIVPAYERTQARALPRVQLCLDTATTECFVVEQEATLLHIRR